MTGEWQEWQANRAQKYQIGFKYRQTLFVFISAQYKMAKAVKTGFFYMDPVTDTALSSQ